MPHGVFATVGRAESKRAKPPPEMRCRIFSRFILQRTVGAGAMSIYLIKYGVGLVNSRAGAGTLESLKLVVPEQPAMFGATYEKRSWVGISCPRRRSAGNEQAIHRRHVSRCVRAKRASLRTD
jgi:hypothetical protein